MGKQKPNRPASSDTKSKASALKRLKASLKDAGVIGPGGLSRGGQTKRQRQNTNTLVAGGNKMSDKLGAIQKAFNPFEVKGSKVKYEVLGRKVKGTVGKGVAEKEAGMEQRKKSLIQELKNKNREGGFLDRRFGENDAFMTPEEKMLERFAKEKQKKVRNASLFNLEDDDNDSDLGELTHMGQSLANFDSYDDPNSSEDEDKGGIGRDVVKYTHFGGFEPTDNEDPDRVKSKAEVMREVIAKSKMHKYERQKLKEDDEKIRMELDDELDDIKGLLFSAPAKEMVIRKPLKSQNSLFKKDQTKKLVEGEDEEVEVEATYEDYDKNVRELYFDQKAQATDRTKTEEEVALEEKEGLEKAERHRLRRMEGLDSDSDEEGGKGKNKRSARAKRTGQADDLDGDEFMPDMDDNFGLGDGVKVRVIDPKAKGEEGSEEEDSEDEEEDSEEDEDEEEDEEGSDEEESEDEGSDLEDGPSRGTSAKPKSKKEAPIKPISTQSELPFTFPLPQTHEALQQLLGQHSLSDQATLLHRARVLYHPKLAVNNKERLQKFMHLILTHICHVTDTEYSKSLIDLLTKHFIQLSIQLPEQASRVAIQFVNETHDQFKHELTEVTDQDPCLETLTSGQLMTFSLFAKIFSSSDYHHAVISPMLLLLGQALLQSPVVSGRCLARNLFMVGIVYECVSTSRRVVPESINTLITLVTLLSPNRAKLLKEKNLFINQFQLEDSTILNTINMKKIGFSNFTEEELNDLKLKFEMLNLDFDDEKFVDKEFLTTLFVNGVKTLRKYIELYGHYSNPLQASPQAFEPILKCLEKVAKGDAPEGLKKFITTHVESMQTTLTRVLASRYPLQLQKHRALAIKQLQPKFDSAYSLDSKSYLNPTDPTVELNKLQKQHNKELKSTIRELRKDARVLAAEKLKGIKEKDEEYKQKVRRIEGEMAQTVGDDAKFGYEKKYRRGQK